MHDEPNRRQFLEVGVALGVATALTGGSVVGEDNVVGKDSVVGNENDASDELLGMAFDPIDNVRIGLVGIGGRGAGLLQLLLEIEGLQVVAVGDLIESRTAQAQNMVVQAGQPQPTGYSRSEHDYERMCGEEDLDLLITATPWRWHVPMCLAAMKTGKHAATEVPAATTVEGCWQLVETAEKTKRHCVMLENCCYGRPEMMVLNMVRQGVFGELVHAEAGYMHDLRMDRELLSPDGNEVRWRLENMIQHNGNLYPTHGLGPVAQCMNIDRGDRFDYLVSMSSKSSGLAHFYAKEFGADHHLAKRQYALGDVNCCMIRTVGGKTITLGHDTQLPRPYSRMSMVQGTEAIYQGYPDRIHIEGRSPKEQWESLEDYLSEYDHPLWQELDERAEGKGHGGMDYMELHRLIQALRKGSPTDWNVYDAASWSVVFELSERSVANRSRPVDFPDFTRGKWKTNVPLGIISA